VPYSRETVYISLMEFYEHLLDRVTTLTPNITTQLPQHLHLLQVMEGSDRELSVSSCGGAPHLAAIIGLAMLPIMDSIHHQDKACVTLPLAYYAGFGW
jgi:hypothetical protein